MPLLHGIYGHEKVGEDGTGETECVKFVACFCAHCDILVGTDREMRDGSGDRAFL